MKEELKNLRFVVTEEMEDTLLKMIVVHQMLDDNKSSIDRLLLKKYYETLNEYFISELHRNNREQIAIYNAIVAEDNLTYYE